MDVGKLIVGLNKYSHDTAICVANAAGEVLFACEKERITRVKHDGGDASALVSYALEALGASVDDVELVVSNNHHHRIAPFEERLPWAVSMGHYPRSALDDANLLPHAVHAELSHHLAHAFAAAAAAPFRGGLVVVMDGMGESHAAMAAAERRRRGSSEQFGKEAAVTTASYAGAASDAAVAAAAKGAADPPADLYYSDLHLLAERPYASRDFQQVPAVLEPFTGYREAESAYVFDWEAGEGESNPSGDVFSSGRLRITPVYKRWQRERSPPELYNHGFENMESLGAVYSRISSHVFGDWNACGKVMGLAPWARVWGGGGSNDSSGNGGGSAVSRLMGGDLLAPEGTPGAFAVDWDVLNGLPHANCLSNAGPIDDDEATADAMTAAGNRPFYAALAARVQADLEAAALPFVAGLRKRCGEGTAASAAAENLCLVGGVALNSVLNGRIARELGFRRVFVPSGPGDEGIAIGCAMFGVHHRDMLLAAAAAASPATTGPSSTGSGAEAGGGSDGSNKKTAVRRLPEGEYLGAYLGRGWSTEEVLMEVDQWEPWIHITDLREKPEVRAAAALAAARMDDAALDAAAADAAALAVAATVAAGHVVAWFQGRSEFGPRALGSRSILADPRDAGNVDRINALIKKREDFRPFAPSVLAEEAAGWFDGVSEFSSPFMSMTAPAAAAV
ncbi:unnamed protein product, partial [Phaeothamnion confervicola]